MFEENKSRTEIKKSMSPWAVWALSFGSAVGWGSFVMPGTTFLPLAGPMGSVIGIFTGALIMLIIGANYHFMINKHPDSGGSFTFAREVFGHDHGFLCAWFLLLVYISIAWANATAMPLIFRNLFGGIFQFGFHYQIAGFDVYFGEVLLSITAMLVFFYLCQVGGKSFNRVLIICAFVLFIGIAGSMLVINLSGKASFENTFKPMFSPVNLSEFGVMNIVALTPWAFVGFESVSHAAEEFNFSPRKSFRIMAASIGAAAFCYSALTLFAASVLPKGCPDWPSYILNLDQYTGFESVPVFHSARTILGRSGIILFILTLLAALFTGIMGNIFSVSRLVFSMARDNMMPKQLGRTDGTHIPRRLFPILALISIPIPFLGRSVIGWIVDINTIGAAIAYLYVSFAAYKLAKDEGNRLIKITGVIGIVCSVFFFLFFLIPNVSTITTLATESYMILVVWSILGFIFFRYIFHHDKTWSFGRSTIVWMVFLFLIFFTTTLWTRQSFHNTAIDVLNSIANHEHEEYSKHGLTLSGKELRESDQAVENYMERIHIVLITNIAVEMALVMIALIILFSLYNSIMQRQKDASEELLKAKNDFLAHMSHEIRTPINTILGMDEMILRETREDETRSHAADIQNAGKMLVSLINDVLDFSRIEAGKLDLVPDEYDLGLLIADMVTIINANSQKKGLSFDVSVNPDMPHILYGDNIRLSQIMLNLLTNAVKYTREGGSTLSVDYEKLDDDHIMLKVSVEDTGIGIKKQDLIKLFDAFERFDEGRNRTIEGTGLGMSIVKQLLDMMDSSLDVESEYGKGTKCSFAVLQKVLNWEPMGNFRQNFMDISTETKGYHSSFAAPDAHILMIDDTEMNLVVLKGLLRSTFLQIDTAKDGLEGLNLTKEKEYDLLLIDHRMPVMDGVEMLKELRKMKDNVNRDKPCICLTANAGVGVREEYLKVGFDDYMIKPVNGKRIDQMLLAHLPEEKVDRGVAEADEKLPSSGEPAPDGDISGAAASDTSVSDEAPDGGNEVFAKLESAGINTADGIDYSGSDDMYIMALEFFRDTADDKRNEIIEYYDNEDWENYVIKVHGLKTTARMIGAAGLSENARQLELAGKADNLDYIHENHEDVMKEFTGLKELLADHLS